MVASGEADPARGPYHGRGLKALFGAWRVLGLEFPLPGQAVRIVLLDPQGRWATSTPRIEVVLS